MIAGYETVQIMDYGELRFENIASFCGSIFECDARSVTDVQSLRMLAADPLTYTIECASNGLLQLLVPLDQQYVSDNQLAIALPLDLPMPDVEGHLD